MEEDRRTRRALDELADLFLTDSSVNADRTHPDAEPADEADPRDAPQKADAPDTSASDAASASAKDDAFQEELVGPDPVRLEPKLPPREHRVEDHVEDRASRQPAPHLRLHRGDDDAHDPADPAPNGAAPDAVETAVRAAIRRGQARGAVHSAYARQAASQANGVADGEADGETGSSAVAMSTDDQAGRRRPTPISVRTEAVLMGNLPGLSGPWLTQYAQLLAQHVGSVAVLHVDERNIDLELVEPTDRPQSSGRVPPKHSGAHDLIEQLDRLLQPGPAQVQAVLVHSEASNRPAAMQRLKALDRWTVLCGADDAAVIGAYRLVKSLVEADTAVSQKQLGVMVVGSDHKLGRAAAEKLSASTRPLLATPAEFVGCQRQMVPVHLRQLGRFGPTATLWPRVADWLADLAAEAQAEAASTGETLRLTLSEAAAAVNPPDMEATVPPDPEPADFAQADDVDSLEFLADHDHDGEVAEAPRARPDTPPQTPDPTRPGKVAEPADVDAADEADSTDSDWAWMHDAADASAAFAAESSAEPNGSRSKGWRERAAAAETPPPPDEPSVAPQPPQDQTDEPDLASFLTARDGAVAGGVALEARCPDQPRTQIVLDQQGRLHLLRRHNSSAEPKRDAMDSLRTAVLDLLAARKWVSQHLELLQLTQRQCRFDGDAAPMLHLFTDRADLATGLAARLGDTLRPHLLQQVRVGDQTTWFCTPLS